MTSSSRLRTALILLSALVSAQVAALGCVRRLAPPPYPLAFAFEGRVPRVLHAYDQTLVPITVTNTGTRAWNPAGVHVSYHWLWLIPRELARRSRTVPYHDGIRTELGGEVKPGAAVPLDGRLLVPRWPGLYWLQWDMVEEGVTWFAQVSPRQPRQLVIVLPTLAGLASPLPLLAALVGLGALAWTRGDPSRSTSFAAAGDVAWCATTLAAKPLVLARDAYLEHTAAAYLLIVVAALTPPLVCLAVFPRRARAWLLLLAGVAGTIVLVGDDLYYRFFGNVLSVAAVLWARQTGQVWDSIRSLFARDMLWLVIDLPFACWLAFAIARRRPTTSAPRSWRLAAATAAVSLGIAGLFPVIPLLRSGRLDQIFSARTVMGQLGPFGYHAFDVWTFARSTLFRPVIADDQFAAIQVWLAERAPQRAGRGPAFGAAAGRSLLVIQVESLQDFAVDYRIDGQPVMPHLAGWAGRALRFTNVTDQTSEGRTSDAEFAALVSLPPLDQGAVAFRFDANHYVGLPGVLAERGYATLSAVPFEPGFWNRRVMHPSYGFQQSLFQSDFELTDQIGWGLNDRDFLQQMAPRLAALPRPFAAWLITLSLHHPFDDFPDRHKVLKLGPLERTSFGNYLHTMHFFDRALAAFEASLARTGLLDDTVLAVFGDHDAGFSRDVASAMGVEPDDGRWELGDRLPFFVRLPQDNALLTGARSVPAGQTDFAPTLLALLGVDPAPLPYMGRNLLGQPGEGVVLRPNGNWMGGSHVFIDRSPSDRGRTCFALERARFVDPAACRAADAEARRARDIARLIVTGDLQQRLRDAAIQTAPARAIGDVVDRADNVRP